ncbi:unnamed protein product [Bursaphelenchus okinawaensis]|uniref:Protein Wnt n=1 Tax=Bursaphelenchus okinawaensis TaxID=465554 RepID=A0A811L353_9BILA|nr:unnamed protein product [Bursaphelenchus okinawaensis]CAG9115203.1 unnamed protein product [Bursaphelenchus okinawaensis]
MAKWNLLLSTVSVLFLTCQSVMDVSWWSSVAQISASNLLASSAVRPPPCKELDGLSPGQRRICELFKDHMPAVGAGAREAIKECESQFRYQKWNCSTPPEAGIIGPVHKYGTREAAFTYAMLSAGVTHEIGRRCKLGMLQSCGCSQSPKPDDLKQEFSWGGCGDNVDYGYKFARNFIDVREKEENAKRAENRGRALMNRWNNEVGRKILKRHTKPKCKCHGVSGSCNLKTCWMQLPSVQEVGNILTSKYRSARRIQINSRGNMQFENGEKEEKLHKRNLNKKKNRSLYDLVYLDDSPDYCMSDKNEGTLGTAGRECLINTHGPASCDVLCCGRGHNTFEREEVTKCNCKFQWCCEVVCEMCRNVTTVHVCK